METAVSPAMSPLALPPMVPSQANPCWSGWAVRTGFRDPLHFWAWRSSSGSQDGVQRQTPHLHGPGSTAPLLNSPRAPSPLLSPTASRKPYTHACLPKLPLPSSKLPRPCPCVAESIREHLVLFSLHIKSWTSRKSYRNPFYLNLVELHIRIIRDTDNHQLFSI